MKFSSLIIVLVLIAGKAHADSCDEFLSFSDQERMLAGLEIFTNATPSHKITLIIGLEEACKGNVPGFSRAEANKDVARILPYLRHKRSTKE